MKNEPNNSMERSRLLVTDRAIARSAPSNRLAHLARSENMNRTHESLPDRPLKRFVIGFSAAGAVGFIVTILYSDTFSEGFIFSPIAMVVVGTISGIISTFGKKALQAILTFAGQIISNP